MWPVFAYYPWVHANKGAVSSAWRKPLLGRLRVQSWPEACMQIEQLKSLRLSRQLPVSLARSPFPIPLLSLPLCQSLYLWDRWCVSAACQSSYSTMGLCHRERGRCCTMSGCVFLIQWRTQGRGRSAWKGKWRRHGKGTKWMRGVGCEEAEARREKETKAG